MWVEITKDSLDKIKVGTIFKHENDFFLVIHRTDKTIDYIVLSRDSHFTGEIRKDYELKNSLMIPVPCFYLDKRAKRTCGK